MEKKKENNKMEYDSSDFRNLLRHYGELRKNELMEITENVVLFIEGKEVNSILDDNGLKFSYISDNGKRYLVTLYLDDIDKEICDKIYEYLCDNSEEYDECDFLEALQNYGELLHDELMDITEDEPLFINGIEVDTILDDDGLKFSYVGDDGRHYSSPLFLDDIDEEICDKIYEYLCDNRNENLDFFNSLSR